MKFLLSVLSLYAALPARTANFLAPARWTMATTSSSEIFRALTSLRNPWATVEDLVASTTPLADRGLATRQEDVCSDRTGITRMICDNVPSREWWWGAGAGRDLHNNWRDGSELKRAEDVVDYHFSLPYILNEKAEPDAPTQLKLASLGKGEETESFHDYVYSERTNIIYYKATRSFFTAPNIDTTLEPSSDVSNLTAEEALEKRQTNSYTINMHIVRRSTATTTARPGCIANMLKFHIANMLKFHIDKSSERNRFACRPIDNKGAHATFWLMINKGYRNTGTYGWCC
ncbi:hypothetical protein CMUS01_15017 [Colletotrichum musicola]|uniref:Uncharacterized protein n=1 Tax=Colletotrichum musicola TaxID=2175873 RepID=A0A8H6MPP7_9PEZI|nr:hypothetical protein CMUS01_15017 [Colletotrichum musicola]